MNNILNSDACPRWAFNWGTLFLRLGLGILMIPTYGYAKLVNFGEKKGDFYNFLGIGSELSMGLAIFAELVCAILIMVGLFARLATIPLMITMVVVISIHDWQLFDKHELAPLFLVGFVTLLFLGPGQYSLDALIRRSKSL